jgi:tRNA (cmo5U34)-methyltransferase
MNIPENWTFENSEVAAAFDRHVKEQLPWYELATGAVAHIVRHYLPHGGLVYDIGASTGNIGKSVEQILVSRDGKLIALESSREMCELYRAPGQLVCIDAMDYLFTSFDVAVCFLTLMFMQPRDQMRLLRRLMSRCKPGGAVVVVDKVPINNGYVQTVLHRLTIAGKVSTGSSADNIVAKELSLMGVQRPIKEEMILAVCPTAEQFFKFGEFTGWILENNNIVCNKNLSP